jgi:NitT/TauT family transport system ATP-binding protein
MLRLDSVSKYYPTTNGGNKIAVDCLNLTINENEFVCIVGRSGCGKTTILRMIAGLETVSIGAIHLYGKRITGPGRERCVVFQKYTLFPWRTVLNNVAFGLEMKGIKKRLRYETAEYFLDLVGLREYANAYPYELSGGMQQRVAVCRALAADPDVLLMDEPFGALDAQTRNSLQNELIKIWQQERKTVLFVTHSIREAVYLADRIIVMHGGRGGIHEAIENTLPRPRDVNCRESRSLYRRVREALENV